MSCHHPKANARNRLGDASDPFLRIKAQNRIKGYPGGSKGTRHGAPHWKLDLIIGPFNQGAKAFKAMWQQQSRKFEARVVFGCFKAKEANLSIWARHPSVIRRLLHQHLATRGNKSKS